MGPALVRCVLCGEDWELMLLPSVDNLNAETSEVETSRWTGF